MKFETILLLAMLSLNFASCAIGFSAAETHYKRLLAECREAAR